MSAMMAFLCTPTTPTDMAAHSAPTVSDPTVSDPAVTQSAAHVSALAHVAIRAASLPATIAFYTRALGLRQVPRPPFNFEGAWLGTERGDALIHLYGGERAKGPDGRVPVGGAAVDHLSLWAHGFAAQQARLQALRLPFRVARVPATTLAQMFVYDPNGVLIELTYDLAREPGAQPVVGGNLRGFEAEHYAQFAD